MCFDREECNQQTTAVQSQHKEQRRSRDPQNLLRWRAMQQQLTALQSSSC